MTTAKKDETMSGPNLIRFGPDTFGPDTFNKVPQVGDYKRK